MSIKKMEHESPDREMYLNQRSILNIDRQVTNKIVGIIFILSFLLWLAAILYGVVIPIDSSVKNPFDQFNTERIFISIGFMLLSAVFTLIAFIALRWVPYITSVILWTFWLPVPVLIVAAIRQPTFWSIQLAIGAVFGCLLILVLLKSEWFHLSEAILKEACKMIFSVPSTLVFALVMYLLSVFVIGITAGATVKLIIKDTTIFEMFLVLIYYFFGIWTLVTIVALSLITLSGTYAQYYYAENKDSVNLGTVLEFFKISCRYHLGTAAMFYPLLGGLRVLYYVIVMGVALILKGPSKSELCYVIYNIFDPVMLRIIYLGSAISCGIKGENFFNSMSNTMNTFEINPKSFLAVVKVLELLMGIVSGLVMFLVSLCAMAYAAATVGGDTTWHAMFLMLIMLGAFVFIGTLLGSITAASYTIFICLFDECTNASAASPNSCISQKLQTALSQDGAPSWFRNSIGAIIPDFEYNADR